jgi:hypothetical protein
MIWLNAFLEKVIPAGSIILSIVSVTTAWITLRNSFAHISTVREKSEIIRNSPIVEDHAELPGFNQQPEFDDVDERS